MYVGFTFSLLAHVALLGWALITFQATPPLKIDEPEPVEVALISQDELVRLTKGDRSSKNLKTQTSKQIEDTPAKKEVKKAVVRTVPPPAASEPPPLEKPGDAKEVASLEPPKSAGPTIEELAAAAAKQAEAEKRQAAEKAAAELALKKAAEEEAKKKADAEKKKKQAEAEKKRKADEAKRKKAAERKKKRAAKRAKERKRKLAEKRRRERERKKKFDPGKLSALLNKIPDSKAPTAGSRESNNDRRLPKGAQAGAREGRDTRLTANEQSFLTTRIKGALRPCWILPGAGGGTSQIPVVVLRWRLKRDGTLDGNIRVMNARSDAVFAAASAAAQRAVIQCQPISLPQELYKSWQTIEWEFDPREIQ